MKKVKDLEIPEFFRYKGRTYAFGEFTHWKYVRRYDRSEKGFVCTNVDDISDEIYLAGNTLVQVVDI